MIFVVFACVKDVGVFVGEYVNLFLFGDDYLMNVR